MIDIEYKFISSNETCKVCNNSSFENTSYGLKCTLCDRKYPNFNKSNRIKDNTVFGYGSLILISSILSRFKDFSIDTSYIYSKNDLSKSYIRSKAIIEWEDSNLNIIPCQINGFKRSYCLDSRRGGKMLGCTRTDNKSDYVNGVLISGLSDEQLEKISSTEDKYDISSFKKSNFSFYNEIPSGDSNIKIYTLKSISNGCFEERNRIYHNRILGGIKLLKNRYDKELVEEFYNDFISSV
jgi:hypothetical protein